MQKYVLRRKRNDPVRPLMQPGAGERLSRKENMEQSQIRLYLRKQAKKHGQPIRPEFHLRQRGGPRVAGSEKRQQLRQNEQKAGKAKAILEEQTGRGEDKRFATSLRSRRVRSTRPWVRHNPLWTEPEGIPDQRSWQWPPGGFMGQSARSDHHLAAHRLTLRTSRDSNAPSDVVLGPQSCSKSNARIRTWAA